SLWLKVFGPALVTVFHAIQAECCCSALQAQCRDDFIQERYWGLIGRDPFMALQRDGGLFMGPLPAAVGGQGGAWGSAAILEAFGSQWRHCKERMLTQLVSMETKLRKVFLELELEQKKHAQDTAQSDNITFMLEKERERLTQQVPQMSHHFSSLPCLETERDHARRMEREARRLATELKAEKARMRNLVLLLLHENESLTEQPFDDAETTSEAITEHQNDVTNLQMGDNLTQSDEEVQAGSTTVEQVCNEQSEKTSRLDVQRPVPDVRPILVSTAVGPDEPCAFVPWKTCRVSVAVETEHPRLISVGVGRDKENDVLDSPAVSSMAPSSPSCNGKMTDWSPHAVFMDSLAPEGTAEVLRQPPQVNGAALPSPPLCSSPPWADENRNNARAVPDLDLHGSHGQPLRSPPLIGLRFQAAKQRFQSEGLPSNSQDLSQAKTQARNAISHAITRYTRVHTISSISTSSSPSSTDGEVHGSPEEAALHPPIVSRMAHSLPRSPLSPRGAPPPVPPKKPSLGMPSHRGMLDSNSNPADEESSSASMSSMEGANLESSSLHPTTTIYEVGVLLQGCFFLAVFIGQAKTTFVGVPTLLIFMTASNL
uniref:Cortactin-binding protein-2 N-terminal domain-containing protein n=1 Tax=Eptatretus burgeri TaxID=7764 RepID=A0A8C4Q983_EPTBU